jgi:hypothetical protein
MVMPRVVLDWLKIFKTVLEKAYFFILCVSIFFGSFVEKFGKWPY